MSTISKSTFERLINWKSPRTKGKLELDNYKKYSDKFSYILSLPTDEKLNQLKSLEGIGISVASTILHFIYPEDIPIVDFRVIECLKRFGYLNPLKNVPFYRDNLKGYMIYRYEILKLASKLKVDLRHLDKALFAFHKIKLS